MQVLNGSSNISLSRTRLAALNQALLQRSYADPNFGNYTESPVVDTAERRISYMDVDSGGEAFIPGEAALPSLPPDLSTQTPPNADHNPAPGFQDPAKQTNPLGWCYPNYFDTPPAFEDSDYYHANNDRPSLGQMISKPLHKLGSRLGSRTGSPHSRPPSQDDFPDMGSEYATQNPVHHQIYQRHPHSQPHAQAHHLAQQPPLPHHVQQHTPVHHVAMRQHFRGADTHSSLHHFTPHG
jgi:hypothetical protein